MTDFVHCVTSCHLRRGCSVVLLPELRKKLRLCDIGYNISLYIVTYVQCIVSVCVLLTLPVPMKNKTIYVLMHKKLHFNNARRSAVVFFVCFVLQASARSNRTVTSVTICVNGLYTPSDSTVIRGASASVQFRSSASPQFH